MKRNTVKKLITMVLTVGMLTSTFATRAYALSENKLTKIISTMPGLTMEELEKDIEDAAKKNNMTEEQVTDQIIKESEDKEKLNDREVQKQMICESKTGPIVGTLAKPKFNGDIYYEPSNRFIVSNGHVGMYWSKDIVVESMVETGVRKYKRADKKVVSGTAIMTVNNLSAAQKQKAADWAYSRIGDKYSYNFATNRSTGYDGAKNCSKLVWSAYMVTANLDLDYDGGLGVYPVDILYSKDVTKYKEY